MTTRRAFLGTLAGGLLAAPLVEAQQSRRVYRIALLYAGLPGMGQRAFDERMRELGWVKGRDFVAEHRSFEGQYEREGDLAAELLRAGVDVFVVQGGYDAMLVQKVTRTICRPEGL